MARCKYCGEDIPNWSGEAVEDVNGYQFCDILHYAYQQMRDGEVWDYIQEEE